MFFFHATATTDIYTLSLHDALPISRRRQWRDCIQGRHYPLQPTVGNSSTWYGHSAAPGSDSLLAQCPCFQLCLWRGRLGKLEGPSDPLRSCRLICTKRWSPL